MATEHPIIVTVWTDGMGTYQARCTQCEWKSQWFRREDLATSAGRSHVTHEARP